VDWYAELSDPAAVTDLRHEVGGFLRRHALASSDFGAADLVVSELLSNVTRHAPGPTWISLTWAGRQPVIVVHDLGPGFELDELVPPPRDSIGGRGLLIASRLSASLAVAARRGGGTRVTAVLPVERAATVQHDPPRRTRNALPALDDAQPTGGFGKESFLLALVVQLARATETEVGPHLVEQLVAQVGTDIGGQMEAEYRAAAGIVGRLTPAQIAECLVRLKHAIDGDFYVIEATTQRIVLGSDSCPFGEAVRMAPGLCRMTSSVFGGIAARNSDDGAAVVLEERIAVGDPGCRVVVHFGPPPDEVAPFSNRYHAAD
jgi:anti-sigma regulatory factor (Ser/Thr protein kinase)